MTSKKTPIISKHVDGDEAAYIASLIAAPPAKKQIPEEILVDFVAHMDERKPNGAE